MDFFEVLKTEEMSKTERLNVMQTMKDNEKFQDEPKVGIFWYSPEKDELFGVTKIEVSELQFNDKGLKTTKTLHKDWWRKQTYRAQAKNDLTSIYLTDYTQTPRGRVFQTKENVFQVMCGQWITDHIKEIIMEEFDLQNQDVRIMVDTHWEIGHGWSEEYL